MSAVSCICSLPGHVMPSKAKEKSKYKGALAPPLLKSLTHLQYSECDPLGPFLFPARAMAAAHGGLGSSKKLVECFYDVVSPYSWLGFECLCRYRHIWNIELRFRPVFLGAIMQATGNKPPATVPKKGEYLTKDVMRMAKYYQVPARIPKDFFDTAIRKGSLSPMRFVTAVDLTQPQFVEPLSRELWMRIWSRDEDITQPESILAAAGKAGIPLDKAQKLLEMSTTPEVKDRLKAVTDEAIAYGAFGAPSFVAHVGDQPQLFFGADRIELLGHFLGEKWLGPVPASPNL